MEPAIADSLATGHRRRVLITGAGGQLGHALQEAFAGEDVLGLGHAGWDVTFPPPPLPWVPDLVLHAAAWTDVDGAEDDPQGAAAVNVGGTQHAAELGAPLVVFSTDYVFDGRKTRAVRRVGLAEPALRLRAHEAPRRGGGGRAGVDRPHLVALRRDRAQLRADDAPGRAPSATRWPSSTTSAAAPTYVGHLAAAVREVVALPFGVWHVAGGGEATWADLAEAIFEEAGLQCRVRRISSDELDRPAPRPANSVLRSEKPGAPLLPHWREGLRACLERLG